MLAERRDSARRCARWCGTPLTRRTEPKALTGHHAASRSRTVRLRSGEGFSIDGNSAHDDDGTCVRRRPRGRRTIATLQCQSATQLAASAHSVTMPRRLPGRRGRNSALHASELWSGIRALERHVRQQRGSAQLQWSKWRHRAAHSRLAVSLTMCSPMVLCSMVAATRTGTCTTGQRLDTVH